MKIGLNIKKKHSDVPEKLIEPGLVFLIRYVSGYDMSRNRVMPLIGQIYCLALPVIHVII